MSLMQTTILAIIQGLTEFLPISSSGHLIILPKIFNWPLQPLAFDAILHLGTLIAVVFYFRNNVWRLAKSMVFYQDESYREERRLAWLILIGITPAGLAGLLFDDFIETRFRSLYLVIFNLIFWGLFLIAADCYNKNRRQYSQISVTKSLVIGLTQILSLIPGTSRSGITIGTGLYTNLNKIDAARFSFLMSIPLIAAAGLFKIADLETGTSLATTSFFYLLIGFLISTLTGWLAIKVLMQILNTWGLKIFGFYRIILAIILLILPPL